MRRLVWAGLILLVVPTACAETGTFTVHGSSRIQLSGLAHLDADAAWMSPDSDSWEMGGVAIRATLYNAPMEYARTSSTPLTPGAIVHMRDLPLEELRTLQGIGRVVVEKPSMDAFIQWQPERTLDITVAESMNLNLDQAKQYATSLGPRESFANPTGSENSVGIAMQPGTGSMTRFPTQLLADSGGKVVVFGGNVLLSNTTETEVIRTGHWINETASTEAATIGGHYVQDRYFLLIEEFENILLGANADLGISAFRAQNVVDAAFHAASGTLDSRDTRINATDAFVQLIGEFKAEGTFSGSPASWNMEGDIIFLGIQGDAALGTRPDVALVASATLGALVLIWMASGGGKYLLFLLGFNKAAPLANANRREVLRLIAITPGISRASLQEKTGLSRTTVMHHIAILLRARFIEIIGDGKIPGYVVNGGTSRFPASIFPHQDLSQNSATLGAQEVFQQQAHPVRRIILEVCRQGPMGYHDVLDALRKKGFNMTRESVSYHCRQLVDRGIIAATKVGRETRFQLVVDLEKIEAHRRRAVAACFGLLPLFEQPSAKLDPESVATRLTELGLARNHRQAQRGAVLARCLGLA